MAGGFNTPEKFSMNETSSFSCISEWNDYNTIKDKVYGDIDLEQSVLSGELMKKFSWSDVTFPIVPTSFESFE